MEAKDTEIKDEQIVKEIAARYPCYDEEEDSHMLELEKAIAEIQAKISFRAGMQEVVNWLNSNNAFFIHPDNRREWNFTWVAQLKKWNIA